MRNNIILVGYLLGLCASAVLSGAAEERREPPADRKEMRPSTPGPRERRPFPPGPDLRNVEKETVAFLGVETGSVSPTISSQLGIAAGTGLVVNHVLPASPAAGVLKEHDILLKLDDQILIDTRQLAVLIRNRKEGDEITMTYMRAGKQATTKVKLAKQEVPKMSAHFDADAPSVRAFSFAPRGPNESGLFENRADVDRVLSLMQRARGADAPQGGMAPPVRIQIDHDGGPGFRAMALNTGNSNFVFDDGHGALELTMKDGIKNLVAKDPQGKTLFTGPVTTPEERKAVPDGVRERLEELEGMRDVTFRTDRDFQGSEMRVVRPRGISFPEFEIQRHESTPASFF